MSLPKQIPPLSRNLILSVPPAPSDLNTKSSVAPSKLIAHSSLTELSKLFANTRFALDAAAGPAILTPEAPPP